MANATNEVTWVQTLLNKVGVKASKLARFGVTIIGATYFSDNLMFHAWTKHIEVDFQFVREGVSQGLLHIRLVSKKEHVADGFTKPLPVQQLEIFRLNLDKMWLSVKHVAWLYHELQQPGPT